MTRQEQHVMAYRVAGVLALAGFLAGIVGAVLWGPKCLLMGLGVWVLFRWAAPGWHDYDAEGE